MLVVERCCGLLFIVLIDNFCFFFGNCVSVIGIGLERFFYGIFVW